jgi:hypothetical protein
MCRTIGTRVTTEFTLLGSLNVQIKKKGGLFKELFLYFYKLKYKIVNIFMGFYINKIIVSRGIGQYPLGSGPYDPYELRRVMTVLK